MTKRVVLMPKDATRDNDAYNSDMQGWHVLKNTIGIYFKHAEAHVDCSDGYENAIVFFTPLPLHGSSKVEIVLKLDENDVRALSRYCVLDISGAMDSDEPRADIAFFLDGRPVAAYYADRHVLLCSDWVHSDDSAHYAKMYLVPDIFSHLRRMYPDKFTDVQTIVAGCKQKPVKILIGCDPEVEAINRMGRVIDACDLEYLEEWDAQIGRDGSGDQIEFRPDPSDSAEGLTDNLRELMTECWRSKTYFSLRGDRYPLGGHIHVSGVEPCADAIEAMDDFVGTHLIDLSGRARYSYKEMTAWRVQGHGGFEYRTPPSAYLHTPDFARTTFQIVLGIMQQGLAGLEYEEDLDEYGHARAAGLSEVDARMWVNSIQYFQKKYNETHGPLLPEGWGFGGGVLESTRKVTFSDQYSVDVRERLIELAENTGRDIQFFGYRNSRGLACNLPLGNTSLGEFGQTDEPVIQENGVLRIGLPLRVRQDSYRLSHILSELERSIRACA